MDGKRFLETYIEVKRSVSLMAWRIMKPLGLGRTQVALLRELGRAGPTTQSALARATATDPSAATRAFAGLTARGWIRRRRGEVDRRESYVELTSLGRRLLTKVEAAYSDIAATLARHLDDRDLAALERIRKRLSALDDLRERGIR